MATATPRPITIALAGNPNSGKTTIFNNLTGARQHVGNYPGVTVEIKEGRLQHQGRAVRVVDLPGTYSLTAYSPDELAARDFIIDQRPEVVVDVLDASNLERNLYLAVQFMELGAPLVLVLNMSDVAEARGCRIDAKLLSELLGATVVQTVGPQGKGMAELKDAILATADSSADGGPAALAYERHLEDELAGIVQLLQQEPALVEKRNARWLAIKLLEDDQQARGIVERLANAPGPIFDAVGAAAERIEKAYGDTPEIAIADQRYGLIAGVCREAVKSTAQTRRLLSERIDNVVLNRLLGIPIFLGVMYLVFNLTFTLGEPPMQWIEGFFGWLGNGVGSLWPADSQSALKSLVVDGVIGGVGGVLVFFPIIVLLFLAIAFLEDSGYMARAAFLVDRFMHKIGLHGKSFIPMLIGFGCTVPAIMATRMLETRRDRLTVMLVLPLMSCSARLSIYALFIPAFFPEAWRAPILWILYLVGILLAIGLIKLLRLTIFRGEITPFVMELPPYRMPTLRGTLLHVWERASQFLYKAGTIIVGISIILWAMMSYPKVPESQLQGLSESQAGQAALSYSVAGRIGQTIEPVMRPVGFDWKTSTALIGAFAAKEVFVAQLGIVHSLGEADDQSVPLRTVLQREYTPLQAFCIMLFCLISIPCLATVATMWQESGSWKWASLQLVALTVLAYLVTLVVYQAGSFLAIGVA